MEIVTILKYIVAGSAVGIIIAVLLQSSSGGGLGTVFGGSEGGETYRTRRGAEALIYRLTIALSIIFAVSALGIAALSV